MTIHKMVLGKIKEAIKKAGGAKQLGKAIGVKTETVNSWVSVSKPSLDNIDRVEKYLIG